MEPSKEPVTVRIARLNNLFLGRAGSACNSVINKQFLGREGLLDALLVLYDECNNDTLKKEKSIAGFVDKFRGIVSELRRLRVNLSDFEVKKVIGRGHFGEVQVVREKQTGDVYAMKTLRKSDTLSQQGAAFYHEERDIMAQTNSPWLTLLQYAFQDMNNLYLVMEFHPGGDLLSLLDRFEGTLSEDMARFYLAELAMAVHSLHNMGYVHRDIKPDNVLIDRCGHLKLADFGSAARLTAAGVVTSQLPVGTPEYIAPEVLQALDQATNGVASKHGNYGMECDYWSLGVVAYEMVMGRTPFSGEQLSATYNNIMRHENTLQFPNDIDTSKSFQHLVMGLLQDAVNRLNHEKLLKHEFFSPLEWTNLRDTVPPFVPVVNSEDDTSNFVEFEYEPPMPSIANFKIRKEFSGKDLPFIGFTYTHDIAPLSSPAEGVSFVEKDKNSSNTAVEAVLAARKKEVEDLHRKLQEAHQPEKWRDIHALERKVEEYTRRLEVVESDRNQLELCLEKCKHEAQALKRILDLEREDRKTLETNAISMIRESKSRWEKCHRQKLEELQKCIEMKENEAIELSSENEGLVSKVQRLEEELKTTHQEIEHLHELVGQNKDKMAKVREKTRMSVAGVETRLEQIAADKQQQVFSLQEELEKHIQYAKELEGRLGEAEAALLEKTAELSVKCDKLHSEKMELYHKLELSIEKYLEFERKTEEQTQKCSSFEKARIVDLEDQLYEEKQRNFKLQEQVMKMEKEKKELREQQEKNTSIQTEWLEERQSQLVILEAELKEAVRVQTELQCHLQEATGEKLRLVGEKVNLEEKLQGVEGITMRLENENVKLKEQLSTVQESNQTLVCNSHADAISELAQQKGFLEMQLEKLEDQLEKVKETLVLERDTAKSVQSQLWKRDKELSDAKIDLRIAQREARTAEQELKVIQEEKSKWMEQVHEDKNTHTRELSASWAKIEKLREEQKGLRGEQEKYQQKIAELSHKLESEKSIQIECKRNLEDIRLQLKAAKDESTNWKRQVDFTERQTTGLQGEINSLRTQNTGLKEERASLIKKIEEVKNQKETLDMNMNVLKETCTMLEEQLEDYDRLFSARDEKDKMRESEIAKLQTDVEKLQMDVRGARQATNEEKSFRICAETKLLQMEADVSSQTECVSTLQVQLQDYKSLAESLTQQITNLENSAGENELVLRSTRRQLEALQEENTGLKEEISKHLTTTHNVREAGFKLSRELEEAIDRGHELEERLAQLQAEMEEQRVFQQHREIKADATLKQQTKLIDFLQRSLLEHGKKKKTLTDKLFGRQKENMAPVLPSGIGSHVSRELEVQLVRERNKVKFLTEQLETAKLQLQQTGKRVFMSEVDSDNITAPATPNTRRVLSHIVQSPASQQHNNFERQPSFQRMHHSIPHRFEPKLSMRVMKCAVCLDSIHFGRHAVVCQECNVTAHPKCSQAMPTTCGLPSGFVHHFSKTWNSNGSTSKGEPLFDPASVEGYVKLPNHGHTGWESHYLRLRGTVLEIFANKPVTSDELPLFTFKMCPSEGVPRVLSAVPYSDVVGTASCDMPFILKVEVVPRTTCWPSATSLLIMALSFPDKQKWVQALESVVQQGSGQCAANSDRYMGQCMMKLARSSGQGALDLNCCVQITDQLLLLGAEEGLYSVKLQGKTDIFPVHILGPTHVHQIALVSALGFAIMIAGESRILVQCDLRHLKTAAAAAECSNPSVDIKPVLPAANPATCCHLFAISPVCGSGHNATVTLCVATSDKFIVLTWNFMQEGFVPVKMLDTSDPCSCIHFTSHSVIVGSNKFFELDLKNFFVEEFMDSSDTTLAHAVVGTRQLNSFPLAVLDVSAPGNDGKSSETEYLLCFNELGVFVDQYGRRSREDDIKWSHLPLSFVYRRPYIIIVHFTSVEVMKLTSSSFTKGKDDTSSTVNYPEQIFIELDNPRYLGTASKSTMVYVSTSPPGSIEVLCLDAAMACRDDLTLSLPDTGSDGADLNDCGSVEFSFTSSLVQSLDGELDSDSSPSEGCARLPRRAAQKVSQQHTMLLPPNSWITFSCPLPK